MTISEYLITRHPELMALNHVERNAILDIMHEIAWEAWRENDLVGVSYMEQLIPEKISRSNFDFWYNIKSKVKNINDGLEQTDNRRDRPR